MRRTWKIAALLLSFLAVPARGQTCAGLLSFSTYSSSLGATVTRGNQETTLGAQVSAGGAGAYGSVGAGFLMFDDIDENAVQFGVGAGYQRPGTSANIALCPVAAFTYISGPRFKDVLFGEDLDLSAWNVAGGLSAGFPLEGGTSVKAIPTASIALAYTKFTGSFGEFESSASDTYGILSFGLGLVLNDRVALRPTVDIPLGVEGADPNFGAVVSIGLARRK